MNFLDALKHNGNKRNTSAEFLGISELKAEHAAQIAQFEAWVNQNDWQKFHDEHYDWWAFPIDAPSSYGTRYTVYADEVSELQRDDEFMRAYLRGAELVAAAWGWDLPKADYLPHPLPSQAWQMWPIRLHKAAASLKLFGCTREFESLRKFGQTLIVQGHNFDYHGRSLKPLFVKGK